MMRYWIDKEDKLRGKEDKLRSEKNTLLMGKLKLLDRQGPLPGASRSI